MISLLKSTPIYIALVSIALFLSSCDEADDMGLDIQPQLDVEVEYSDTTTILASTILIDSINTSNASLLMVGQYEDAQLGKIKATSYFTVVAPETITFGTNPTFGRAVLTLQKKYSYGDTTALQKVSVHLIDKFETNTLYYNNTKPTSTPVDVSGENSLTYQTTSIGEYSYNPSTFTGKTINIPLNDDFKDKLVKVRSETDVANLIKGIALVSEEGDAIIGYDASETFSASIDLYYTNQEFGSKEKKFRIALKTPYVSDNKRHTVRHNHVTADRTGYDLSVLNNPYDSANISDKLFLQSSLGIMVRLHFPYLKKYHEIGELALNRAELIIPLANKKPSSFYKYPAALELLISDQQGKILRKTVTRNNVDEFGNIVNFFTERFNKKLAKEGISPLHTPINENNINIVPFIPLNRSYNANITSYMQFLLNGYNPSYKGSNKIENNGLIISPLYYNLLLDRVVLGGPKSTTPLKLKLYYTSIK